MNDIENGINNILVAFWYNNSDENIEMYYHQLKHASYPLLLTTALVDIIPICKAHADIMDQEGCLYDHDDEAAKADALLKYFSEVEKDVKSNSDN